MYSNVNVQNGNAYQNKVLMLYPFKSDLFVKHQLVWPRCRSIHLAAGSDLPLCSPCAVRVCRSGRVRRQQAPAIGG